jgi:hypothetical protein
LLLSVSSLSFFDGKYPHLLTSQDFERYLQDDDANATGQSNAEIEWWLRSHEMIVLT